MRKTVLKKTAIAVLSAGGLLALQACGGGGGGGGAEPVAGPLAPESTPAPVDSGSATAFKAGAAPRFQLVNARFLLSSGLSTFKQEEDGSMTDLNGSTLTGQKGVQDISGDEGFALGRWVAGTANIFGNAETLTGVGRGTYHYVVYNVVQSLPTSGSLQCDTGAFSTPTSQTQTGTASGTAMLSFTGLGATIDGQINVAASDGSASAPLGATNLAAAAYGTTGDYDNDGSGAYLQVADAGGGAYAVAGRYRAVTPGGVSYVGVFRLACK